MEVIVLKKCPMCGSNRTKLIDSNKRVMCPICHEWAWRNESWFNQWADIVITKDKEGK